MAKATFALFFCVLMVIIHQNDALKFYTRWGRTKCNNPSFPLYKGFAASGHHANPGEGATILCVHESPEWGTGSLPGEQAYRSAIHGMEYELYGGYTDGKPFSFANNGGSNLNDQDIPCVVCVNPSASDQIMIPARRSCPSTDMTLEYKGYLAGSPWNHGRLEYICIDEAPEARPGGQANNDEGMLFPTQVYCGSLPCPPYVAYNEMACAVCTM